MELHPLVNDNKTDLKLNKSQTDLTAGLRLCEQEKMRMSVSCPEFGELLDIDKIECEVTFDCEICCEKCDEDIVTYNMNGRFYNDDPSVVG